MTSHLVVVDMQRVFADPGGEWSTPRFGEILPVVADLVTAAKRARQGLTFTRFVAPAARTTMSPARMNPRGIDPIAGGVVSESYRGATSSAPVAMFPPVVTLA